MRRVGEPGRKQPEVGPTDAFDWTAHGHGSYQRSVMAKDGGGQGGSHSVVDTGTDEDVRTVIHSLCPMGRPQHLSRRGQIERREICRPRDVAYELGRIHPK